MWVSDVMTTNPITVSPEDKIFKVVKIFETNKIGSVLVVQSGRLVGIVTRSDLKNRSHDNSDDVSKIMSKNVQTIHPNADVKEAEYRINQLRINGLAVVYESKVVGIITRYDIQSQVKKIVEKEERKYHHKQEPQIRPIQKTIPKTKRIRQSVHKSGFIGEFLGIAIVCIIFGAFITNIAFPFILMGVHPNMQGTLGNPKPLYLYSLSPSCTFNNDIESALEHLSSITGIKFVQIPSPLGLILGGVQYTCEGSMSNYGASGEAESGMVGASYFIFVWNNIRLQDTNEEVVIHETLHTMGFAHSNDPNSIMYPIGSGYSQIDPEIVDFLKTWYVNNPFAYLNIITLNMMVLGILLLIALVYIFP